MGGFHRRWLLPPGVHDVLSRTTAAVKSAISPSRRARRRLVKENEALRDRHRGRRCFIIGNGPSLAQQDLAPLADDVTIVMNAFYRHPILKTGWRPTIHCMAEPAAAYDDPRLLQILRDCATGANAHLHVFPIEVRDIVRQYDLLPDERVRYVDFRGTTDSYPSDRQPTLTDTLPYMTNTAHLSLVVAMHLGCSPIYLMGMDHDWLAHKGFDRHFYAHQGIESESGSLWDLDSYPYLELMESSIRAWRDYIWLRRIAEQSGFEILNASHGGFLDVFPRADYTKVVGVRTAA
ncbi:MAG: DUF115 domain-containing protein [Pirellulaceae bacterium]